MNPIEYISLAVGWVTSAIILACGLVQLGRSRRFEVSVRSGIGLAMISIAGLLIESLAMAPPHPILLVASLAISAACMWLVWVPHTNPVLERCTTGFGLLEPQHPQR